MKILIKTLLNEGVNELKRKEYLVWIKKLIPFLKEYLHIKGRISVRLTNSRKNLITTASYSLNKIILVYIKDRSLIDILKSICHEAQHQKQHEDGRLSNIELDGKAGSEIENEANAKAGEVIRVFGKKYPIIYEL